MFQLDRFSSFSMAIIGLGSLLTVWISIYYLEDLRINHGEYYSLLLLATAGMFVMVAAVDLITLFMGLELMSIPVYALAGFDRRKLRSNESALKYFLIGAFASAILLYGMALLYGVTGRTDYAGIAQGFEATNPLALAGLGLVLVGFAFKVAAVPFHQWAPDVYEGSPTSVTAFMAVTVKATAFAALVRFVLLALPEIDADVRQVFALLAGLTLVVGNVMAVIQENVKRLLAYSGIAHAGYMLLGFAAATPEGFSAVVFYLFTYVFINVGAFGVVIALARGGRECDRIDDFAGLAKTRPGLAAVMTLCMVALAGIPGTAGFIAKFQVFSAAVSAGQVPLTLLAVLASLVSVYYYLRIPVAMYMREAPDGARSADTRPTEELALGVCAAAVVYFGLFPNHDPLFGVVRALDLARGAVAALL
jgi:NADH-quinone oxidoreductase subunit N